MTTIKHSSVDLAIGQTARIAELKAELEESEGVIRVWRRRAIEAEAEVERLAKALDRIAYTETEGLKHLRFKAHPMSHEVAVEALRSETLTAKKLAR